MEKNYQENEAVLNNDDSMVLQQTRCLNKGLWVKVSKHLRYTQKLEIYAENGKYPENGD